MKISPGIENNEECKKILENKRVELAIELKNKGIFSENLVSIDKQEQCTIQQQHFGSFLFGKIR